MNILCLDSSGYLLKTGLFSKGTMLAETARESNGNHSAMIILQVQKILKDAGKELNDLDLLAVNLGPGSFTGLRIGLAAMAGLGYARSIRLTGSSAFEIMARDIRPLNGRFMALIHCRGEEFYSAGYYAHDGQVEFLGEYKIVNPKKMLKPENDLTLVGPGGEEFYSLAGNDLKRCFKTAPDLADIPSLRSLAEISLEKAEDRKFDGRSLPELFYLSPSQAEVNYARKKGID